MIHIEMLVVTELAENTYIVWNDAGDCLVIDPGDAVPVLKFLKQQDLKPSMIINTHGHIDHVAGNTAVRKATGARIGIHAMDAPMLSSALYCGAQWVGWPYEEHQPDFLYAEGETVGTGELQFEALFTPGHSPGSCSLVSRTEGIVFSGDLVFMDSVGRSDLPGGDEATLFESIRDKFLLLPDAMKVYPGHGPETTVGRERRLNPFLSSLS